MKGKENDILPLLIIFKAAKSHEGNMIQDTVITKSLMFGNVWKKFDSKNLKK